MRLHDGLEDALAVGFIQEQDEVLCCDGHVLEFEDFGGAEGGVQEELEVAAELFLA